jgi:hypothetical protein
MVPNVIDIVAPAGHAEVAAAGELKSKLFGGGATVIFALLISKKIFPIASTFILPSEVVVLGTTIVSLPSFGVLATSTVEKV